MCTYYLLATKLFHQEELYPTEYSMHAHINVISKPSTNHGLIVQYIDMQHCITENTYNQPEFTAVKFTGFFF